MSDFREFYSGFVRLHILYHASKEAIFGLGIMEELRRHGYEISPGTLYPILHGMEGRGYLRSATRNVNGKLRRVYAITSLGRRTLKKSQRKVRELFQELWEGR